MVLENVRIPESPQKAPMIIPVYNRWAYEAEILDVVNAVGIAWENGQLQMWLESDSLNGAVIELQFDNGTTTILWSK